MNGLTNILSNLSLTHIRNMKRCELLDNLNEAFEKEQIDKLEYDKRFKRFRVIRLQK